MIKQLLTLAEKFLDLISLYLRHETGSPVGIINLLIVFIVAVAAVALFYTNPVLPADGVKPTPELGPLVVLGALGIIAFVAVISWVLIPKKPPV